MARSLNRVMLIGNLGKDAELRYTTSGKAVATFSMATSESWKDADGNAQEKTEWHNIVAWGKLAEICGEWLKKGKKIYAEGRLQTRSWEKDGVKKYTTEIVMDNMLMLDGKDGGTKAQAEPEHAHEKTEPAGQDKDSDSLPF